MSRPECRNRMTKLNTDKLVSKLKSASKKETLPFWETLSVDEEKSSLCVPVEMKDVLS